MSITHVLAVVPVSDLKTAQAWYENVRLRAFRDPDGNTVTFIGNFRVDY